MRSALPKMKYVFYILALNSILVPLALRYWTCYVQVDSPIKMEYIGESVKIHLENERKLATRSTCTPKKNIVFLKTHKTGSSTITNILNRYGEENDLTFVLPRVGENRLDWPWFFQADSFYPLNGTTPNILCNHARFNKRVMEEIMPNNTVYVTILRNPIDQFESTFNYMTLDKILGMTNTTNPLENFFKDPDGVLVNYVLTQDLRINSDRLKLIRNGMFYDLGLESKDFENDFKVREAIDLVDQQFHLVMITEYFEESVVLLRRLLCWDLDDMVYFTLNARAKSWYHNMSKSLQRKVKRWSRADTLLYDHFNRTFWKLLRKLEPDFWEEVKMLRAKNNAMREICLSQGDYRHTDLFQTAELRRYKLRKNIPFVAKQMCKRMTWDEIKYLRHLRETFIEKVNVRNKASKDKDIVSKSFDWIRARFYS